MSDVLLEPEDQTGEHQVTKSGACAIPGCPCRGWSAQETAGVKEVNEHDPWKAVHRIKLKHEKVVEAAITAINCYQWQGQEQAKYLAEAMNELDKAVAALQRQSAASKHESAARGGGDEWHVGSRSNSPEGDATIYTVKGNRWIGQVKAKLADQIVTEHNQHQSLVAERERLRDVLRRLGGYAAAMEMMLNTEVEGEPLKEAWAILNQQRSTPQ